MPMREEASEIEGHLRRGRKRIERLRLLIEELVRDGHVAQVDMAQKLLAQMFRSQDLLQQSQDLVQGTPPKPMAVIGHGQPCRFWCKRCGFDAVVHKHGPDRHAIDY